MNSYQFDSLKFATEGLTGYGSTVIMDLSLIHISEPTRH